MLRSASVLEIPDLNLDPTKTRLILILLEGSDGDLLKNWQLKL